MKQAVSPATGETPFAHLKVSMSNLSLSEARGVIANYVRDLNLTIPRWEPKSIAIKLKETDVRQTINVGSFSGFAKWDEPARMPSITNQKTHNICVSTQATDLDFGSIKPQIVFAPCLLADKKGNRIGRGKGYYDRYLKEHPNTFAIGVVHSDYVLEEIPSHWLHEADQKLDALVSDKDVFQFSHSKGELLL